MHIFQNPHGEMIYICMSLNLIHFPNEKMRIYVPGFQLISEGPKIAMALIDFCLPNLWITLIPSDKNRKTRDQKISQEIPPSHRHAATYKGVGRVLYRGGSLALLTQYIHCNNEFLCSKICYKKKNSSKNELKKNYNADTASAAQQDATHSFWYLSCVTATICLLLFSPSFRSRRSLLSLAYLKQITVWK